MARDTTRPVRVLIVDHTAPVASVRRRWHRVAEESDIEMTLVAPHAWRENSQWTEFQDDPEAPYRAIVGRTVITGYEIRSVYLTGLARALKQTRPDVIIMMEEAFSMFAVQVMALRRLYAPSARVAFYACWILPYKELRYRPAPFFQWVNRTMLARLDAAMCINDKATEMLHAAGFAGARTNFFGVDERLFTRVPRDDARAAVAIDPNDLIVLSVGRLLELKGVDDLVDAFTAFASNRPELPLRLIILGSGDYEPSLRERARASGVSSRIEIRGAVPNEQIRLYMCAADVFVLPSRAAWKEQFGRVLAEAMLVETPVIGSTSGEIPRVIGDGGFLYPADDVPALTDALRQVFDDRDDVARRVAIGRAKALAEYSVAAFVRRTIELIEELAGRGVRRNETEEATA